ncbi:hypothetical protein Sta7437_4223 [Stanieria cyanosphaera PCC 7437]|uniref:Uncharacterized protein n=1 Tax=Stanieria cyanosphaera (strain ATCC 29371 / PCC 7437) TaxID=111780 RepID=K9XZY3_STAC7|nr:hypothetical protein [Stanieria cyanosphaera]AFZ37696.1 hypothetical protein Sta7437_4223 [Stanieria cyanosphaera PCC 7437]
MKTYEKIEIIRPSWCQAEQLKIIFLVIVSSLAVGLIPIIYSVSMSQPGDYSPIRATSTQ